MASRYGPGVLPDRGGRNVSEDIARAIELWEEGRAAQEARERAKRSEGRQEVGESIAFQRGLREEGLRHATPRALEEGMEEFEGAAAGARETTEQPFDPQLRDRRRSPLAGAGTPGFQRGPRFEGDLRGAFDTAAAAGPSGLQEPLVLPGQFQPGAGFASEAVFPIDLESAPGAERIREPAEFRPPREVHAGSEFERVRPPPEERQAQAVQQEVERLIAAGVPRELAPIAQQDPALAREFLRPEGEEGGFTEEELRQAGVPEEAIPFAVRDPVLGRQIVRAALEPGEEEEAEFTEQELRQAGVPPALIPLALKDRALARQLVTGERASQRPLRPRRPGEEEEPELPPDVKERRANIVSLIGRDRIVQPWQQDIVDMLSGIGPDGGASSPMDPQAILEGYRNAGASEEDLQRVEDFLLPVSARFGG